VISSRSLLLLLLAGLLGAGCVSTGTHDQPVDSRGVVIPEGVWLDHERYDDGDTLAAARTLVVVPFEVAPEAGLLPLRVLQSAASMAAEECTRVLLSSADLDAVGLGDGSERAELVARGWILRYDGPLPGVRIQKVTVRCEVSRAADGELVAVLQHTEWLRKDQWESEESGLKRLCRSAGARLGAVIARKTL
jgi:hypothetical protein